jgi:hypothetical protein
VVLDGLGHGQAPLQGQHDGRENGGNDGHTLELVANVIKLFTALITSLSV